ncbi:hypothetical protein TNCT_220741 [Trichonephila clavata]|uniref:Uncharacterized protein n=1 Tax=Trichonephila clavata TaxID=2740835 RepID=A0A8X6I9T3_TRICU|nr:hypothetical protein TNCT_220741 [Trichonephila clavata]
MNLSLTQLEEKLENFPEIADNNSSQNCENVEFEITTELQTKSDDSIINNIQNTVAFSTGMDETAMEKFSPFAQRSNISKTSEQVSMLISETSLFESSKYTFYDDNGKTFFLDNADFEEEKKELIDIFNLGSAPWSDTSNTEMGSCNEAFHF